MDTTRRLAYARPMPIRRILAAGGLLLLVFPSPSAAGTPYRLEPAREWTLVGLGAALGVTGLVLTANVDALTPDEVSSLDTDDINDFDREGIQPYREDHAGDVLATASYLLPLTFFTHPDTKRDVEILAGMWAEAALLNIGLNGVVKAAVLRTRPYAYDPDAPIEKRTSNRARLSFYSGHAASAAMNCFFMAHVFSDYLDDGKVEAAIWTGAVLYPAVTGFLRVDTGHHFRTDALMGYVIGAAIGYLVPELHRKSDEGVSVQAEPVAGSMGIGLTFAF